MRDQTQRFERLERDFRDLLSKDRHTSRHESEIQAFLEANPFFLPNMHSSDFCPERGKVVRKPPLGDFTPDFALSCVSSLGRTYVLIEIEDPCKQIFTKRDAFTSDFRQAEQQMKDWLGAWPAISDRLATIFREARVLHRWYELHINTHLKCYLVFGRRSEIEVSRKRQERWSVEGTSLDRSLEIMTYDRLFDRAAPWVSMGRRRARTYAYADRKLSRVGEEARTRTSR